ncbi:class I SAM-dependent DNA methyltransferase [Klebsiella pneumoniae]|uniref:class I SAM-dependent DNA methyltransferase n=1 Tax=Klebsiella pneumoniae TaxID=573 RepID=UPI0018CB325B|nr:class I SAM-dependent DNA methyltransferase [Klebsiella pneumoniae]EKV0192405.1 class I SAM-dependent DNA methyltransferase [Klebsiella pneumoniae]MBG9410646.1 class I SAM-dependent DNA methyltransferase [Klebsiella pneumoniae]MBR7451225.1 class I SAM-dependent DNA methyltransferase [Klebsiella pneumoniae]MDM9257272.1 class I SAM-dependent DNA methyltransferase [Klebsiella pneumoniae]MDR4579302.1 class I SAM-dependent DNA methyltransferase [Klebsiella pneumoniae]
MNAVEIEQAITDLAEQPFDSAEFPYAFLEAFGNKATTIKRLRAGASNKSDLGGVLQTNNIHILTSEGGQVTQMLAALKTSPATGKAKAKFILATDGKYFEAEDLNSGQTVACAFKDFPDHFGFFLPLAGISTVRQISEDAFDIRATSRLNRLYVELLKDNPEWGTAERRHDMNKFMARLIFCFFAEDTEIFIGKGRFTDTIAQMSERDASNIHEVIATLFRAMNTPRDERTAVGIPRWATEFPYVNGALFSGSVEVPHFSRIARSYLLHVGNLDWTRINPDIFGSMIQAITEDEERGELGMHYTSVPNILKVLNPLFLDELRAKLDEAGDNPRMLLNLRKRMARIRVFDPACGSGNFLVIAYKEMRAIEAEINRRRGEVDNASAIPLTNFRGIEIRDFPAEIARLALVIAEYQCDVLYRGLKLALAEFLPLRNENWITCGNALRIDWLSVCPATGTNVKWQEDDLFDTPLKQAEINFQNEGGETYICGNPPYKGSKWQSNEQKADLANAWRKHPKLAKTTDFVTGWFACFFDYADKVPEAIAAFVTTNSVCQGQQASEVWPVAFERGCELRFAHTSFKWANLAAHNAGVSVVIIGLGKKNNQPKLLYQDDLLKQCTAIGPYLVPESLAYVQKANAPIGEQSVMFFGNMPRDGGHLLMDAAVARKIIGTDTVARRFIKRFVGSEELINGKLRYCLWIEDDETNVVKDSEFIAQRLRMVAENRSNSSAESTRSFAKKPYRFVQIAGTANETAIVVPKVSSESREYLPVGLVAADTIVSDLAFALYDAPLWNLALIASRLHLVWIATVCGKLETRYRYSNTLGWNTFPLPTLTEKNKADLTRCAEDILLTREHHFPATIADLYDPEKMPDDLRIVHERNDEVLERIYIGRRFKNDTERLEKLFDLYTRMVASSVPVKGKKHRAGANK